MAVNDDSDGRPPQTNRRPPVGENWIAWMLAVGILWVVPAPSELSVNEQGTPLFNFRIVSPACEAMTNEVQSGLIASDVIGAVVSPSAERVKHASKIDTNRGKAVKRQDIMNSFWVR